MRALPALALTLLLTSAAWAGGLTQVELNGTSYHNITKVYVGGGGRIIILYDGGGTSASADKVPANFLTSWNIGDESRTGALAAEAAEADANLDRAIHAGSFREVEGVVYDTRKPQSGWVTFHNVRVLQFAEGGALVDPAPGDQYSIAAIFVKHLPPTVGDTDFITITVRQIGTFSYINKANGTRTIRSYDLGRVCERADIPDTVLSGKKPFETIAGPGTQQTDIVAGLPESGDLQVSGSGFFVSANGYLVTNNHVVKNARRLKVKTGSGIFPATVVRTDPDEDLALLKVEGHFQPLAIASSDAQLGDAVFTIGFPDIALQGTQPKYTDGKISSLAGIRDDPTEYQISVPVQPGNSGGPLVDMNGSVKGVVVARLDDFAALRSMGGLPQNVNYAIKGRRLRDFLAKGAEVNPAAEPPANPGTGVISIVQQSVAMVRA